MRRALHGRQRGLSYVELLVASALIAATLLPALQALQGGAQGAAQHARDSLDRQLLVAKLEAVLARPFAELAAAATAAGSRTVASSLSDAVPSGDGRTLSRQVFLGYYDGDNADADNDPFSGTDPGLLWVRVVIAGSRHELQSLTRQ
ncbi:hypothetical protein [Pseudomonas benzenivorans]|uniref:Prepilin-type N-terminal cleavage/methylation domain-containing protein n=1 Tax=Pseudomonas benzenivorans TaxID=556533 RepID=A0ABY5H7U3_9PSED|nr:hypothetical protein [Pseudomonas benzenivorans]UTW07131.1 hypothetical protein KDW96_18480 [Pseudomonas benzenivorans]